MTETMNVWTHPEGVVIAMDVNTSAGPMLSRLGPPRVYDVMGLVLFHAAAAAALKHAGLVGELGSSGYMGDFALVGRVRDPKAGLDVFARIAGRLNPTGELISTGWFDERELVWRSCFPRVGLPFDPFSRKAERDINLLAPF